MTSIQQALKALQDGRFVIISDDKDRENEGDLVVAAEKITPEHVAFLLKHTGGVICVPMTRERLDQLNIPQMVLDNTDPNKTAFTVSVDYKIGTTTGISAQDRAKTIRALAHPQSRPEDFTRPGHVFPLRCKAGGVLKRAGHTEASIDLLEMASLAPVGAISEIVNPDGSMTRNRDLKNFSEEHGIPLLSVSELIKYRRKHEVLVECVSQASIPTEFGLFTAYVYQSKLDGIEHMALVKGNPENTDNVAVRVHSECLTGDVFGSLRCECGLQLKEAMRLIADEGCGVVVYLRGHEGRGIGLGHKLRAYGLQDTGLDTVEANEKLGLPVDSREYGIGAQILSSLGVTTLKLMTNNPAKYGGIDGYGLKIVERIPLIPDAPDECRNYLKTKKEKMGHLLEIN